MGSLSQNLLVTLSIICLLVSCANSQLSPTFYDQTCPSLQRIVRSTMIRSVNREPRLGASILRLFFHDCFVNVPTSTTLNLSMYLSINYLSIYLFLPTHTYEQIKVACMHGSISILNKCIYKGTSLFKPTLLLQLLFHPLLQLLFHPLLHLFRFLTGVLVRFIIITA